jgi:tetratricopeptide (TPR) repeat protein
VSEPSADAYDLLRSDAKSIVLGLAVLELDAISAAGVAVLAERATPGAALVTLVRDGWIAATGQDSWSLVPAARDAVAGIARMADPALASSVAGRFAGHHLEALRPAEAGSADDGVRAIAHVAAHRSEIVAAVGGAARRGHTELAIDLALLSWRVAGHVPDPAWWRMLAERGEAAAVAARRPVDLTELLHRSAEVFAAAEDHKTAEAQWSRARALARELGDGQRVADVQFRLGRLYRDWGRLHRALDTYLELIHSPEDAADLVGVARAMTEVGMTMLEAGRPADALAYLTDADKALDAAEGSGRGPVRWHADVVESLGRLLDEQGSTRAAQRMYSRALAMLIDVDDEAADRVRQRLAAVVAQLA